MSGLWRGAVGIAAAAAGDGTADGVAAVGVMVLLMVVLLGVLWSGKGWKFCTICDWGCEMRGLFWRGSLTAELCSDPFPRASEVVTALLLGTCRPPE